MEVMAGKTKPLPEPEFCEGVAHKAEVENEGATNGTFDASSTYQSTVPAGRLKIPHLWPPQTPAPGLADE